jgi:hypothetical protein
MASEYLYGTYGQLANSVVSATAEAPSVALYVGTAPVNLVRGYATAGIINTPVKIANYTDAQAKIGVASDWDKYTLSEAVEAHFNNANGNVGPIYVINVLDPTTHRKSAATTKSLNFVNGSATFASEDIILDTLAIAGKAEGTDYAVSYNFTTHKVTILSIDPEAPLDGAVTVTYNEVDTTDIDTGSIIGTKSDTGVYTGLQAAELIYQKFNAVVNLIAAPKWSQYPSVYKAMVAKATKLNGHWDSFVLADIPLVYDVVTYPEVTEPSGNPSEKGYYELVDGEYVPSEDSTVDSGKTYYTKVSTPTNNDTIAKAKTWKTNNGYTAERSKVFYPKANGTDGNVYFLSTLACVETLRLDLIHNGVPMETCGNKEVAANKQYFGASSTNAGYSVTEANQLCAAGIDTLAFWGGAWRLWGDHTAAYTFDSVDVDPRAIFDVSMRMLFYLTNRFQITWATTIDKPFTVQLKDTILVREQERLDALVTMGALVGTPRIAFEEAYNSIDDIKHGNFRWDIQVTPTPPLKSASAYVAYTDAGLSAFF